ncbi:pteridine reductase [Denitratisoma sp. DHT3]|uniref:pteridine reductase n=1 Tax=Denitratisoma sp. DHT3 TaxID=1981880 RepID=UPI001198A2F4|nr:pteridine reductase [Denitratisoma sp. DHT3]QDX81926.1 pteridine reductase [Denitratisoma sp. DHT3]
MDTLPDQAPVVLVTGAARRVGAEIARLLHAAGARLVLHYRRSAPEAEALAATLNRSRSNSAATVQADLCDSAALERTVAVALERFGRLDGLVNNASSFFRTPLGSIDQAAWQELVGSNFQGPLFLAQAAAPHLRASGGAIVNITDVHAERPLRGYPVYSAAKAGLLGLTRALAIELAPRVRVNAVAPGAVDWPENDQDFPPEERQAIIAHTLLQRIGTPMDIARTVRFLLFDAPYITGQVINVDGGRTAQL